VRTLHYYDEIGLLRPAFIDENTSYRYYDEASLLRMQEILFYRELDFSLKNIIDILSSPNYDKNEVLKEQKKLLMLKKERLERLILAIDSSTKGDNVSMIFDNSEFENYKSEVKEKWGNTKAYNEHLEKTKNYSKDKWNNLTDEMNNIFKEFSICMRNDKKVNSIEVINLVKMLQDFITLNYYECTNKILAGLGQMYVLDERFKNNIDKFGDGTAKFVSEAIKVYCE
jgi:DNA-binding transcriptional MerR regulator